MPDVEIARLRAPARPAWPAPIAVAVDKALRVVPKCLHCGKAKNQHRAVSAECPIGKRTPTGYAAYAAQRFAGPAAAA